MNHIETKSESETKAREKYAKATDGIVVASDDEKSGYPFHIADTG